MSDAFFLFDDDEMLGDWWGGHSTVGPRRHRRSVA